MLHSYKLVQSALKGKDLKTLKCAKMDLSKQINASITSPKSANVLLASVYDEASGLTRNIGAEVFVPQSSLKQKMCTAIR